jgi:hypothetical protein
MQILSSLVVLANLELELSEGIFKGFPLAALAPRCGIFGRNLLQILTDQSGQGRVPVHSDLADFFDEGLVERKSHVHCHMISATLIMCKSRRWRATFAVIDSRGGKI